VTGPVVDASGAAVALAARPRRIVSLVPSLTELLFTLGRGDAVVGCTIFCTEPRGRLAGITRIGGEKNPDLERIRGLAPDLVVANVEENLREHVLALRGWSIPVYVIYPRRVTEGIAVVRELGGLIGAEAEAGRLADGLDTALARRRAALAGRRPTRVFCPIWRRPWMTINADTYVHDVLAVCGGDNVFGSREKRYPEVTLEEVAAARPEAVLLPDEPYRFRRTNAADFEAWPGLPAVAAGRIHLVDGKLLSWYGPRIAEALERLPPLLATGEASAPA
jgi:ABC-type Fe3+-hydroxamate transport system substrate-binding protein